MAFDVEEARKAGYSDTEIADHLAQQSKFDAAGARQAGYTDADIVSHLVSKTPVESFDKKPASAAKRFVYGLAEPAIGAAQLLSRFAENPAVRKTIAAFPMAGIGTAIADRVLEQGDFEQIREQQDEQAAGFAQKQREMAPEGIDWARAGGQAVALIPTAFAGGPAASIWQLGAKGALAGGIAGAATPVEDAENYAATKAMQTGAGAVVGAIAAPVAQKAADLVGRGLTAIKAQLTPKMPIADIRVKVENVLREGGVDLGQLPPKYADTIAREVKGAIQSGGSLDERALVNIATAKTLGVDLTKGQATQQPVQYAKETFLRQGPGGEALANQYTGALGALNRNIDRLASGREMPPATLNVEAGRKALDALRAADKPAKQAVDTLYEAARAKIGIDDAIDQRTLVDTAFKGLQEAGVVDKLPSQFVTELNRLSKGGAQLTMREAQMMIRAANQRIANSADPVEKVAVRIFKNSLDDAIDATGTAQGQEAAAAFRLARGAAAKRFQKIEQIPVLKDAIEDGMAPDDFMRKAVYNAKLDDMKALRSYLRGNNRAAWNQIRSQVLNDIKTAATRGSDEVADFSSSAFNKQLNALKQSGKLGLMFSPSEIKTLEAVGRVGRLVQQGPPGVLRTGAMGNAQALGMLMKILGKLPTRVGALAQAAGQKGANVLESNASLRAPALASAGKSVIPAELTARLGTSAAAAAAPLAIAEAQ